MGRKREKKVGVGVWGEAYGRERNEDLYPLVRHPGFYNRSRK